MPQEQQEVRTPPDDQAACRPSSEGAGQPCLDAAGRPATTHLQQQPEQSNACPQEQAAGLCQRPRSSDSASRQPAAKLNADPANAMASVRSGAQPGGDCAPSRAQPAVAHLHRNELAHHQNQGMPWHDQESSARQPAQERRNCSPLHGTSSQEENLRRDSSPMPMPRTASGHDRQQRPQDGHLPPSPAAQTTSGQAADHAGQDLGQHHAVAPRDPRDSQLPEGQMSTPASAVASRGPDPSIAEQSQPADICLDSIDIERQRR